MFLTIVKEETLFLLEFKLEIMHHTVCSIVCYWHVKDHFVDLNVSCKGWG